MAETVQLRFQLCQIADERGAHHQFMDFDPQRMVVEGARIAVLVAVEKVEGRFQRLADAVFQGRRASVAGDDHKIAGRQVAEKSSPLPCGRSTSRSMSETARSRSSEATKP